MIIKTKHMEQKSIIYYPPITAYFNTWNVFNKIKAMPYVVVKFEQYPQGKCMLTGILFGPQELIHFTGDRISLVQECMELVRRVEAELTLPQQAILCEELENGAEDQERDAERVNDYYEQQLMNHEDY